MVIVYLKMSNYNWSVLLTFTKTLPCAAAVVRYGFAKKTPAVDTLRLFLKIGVADIRQPGVGMPDFGRNVLSL